MDGGGGPAGACRWKLNLGPQGVVVRLGGALAVRGSRRRPAFMGRAGYVERFNFRITKLVFYGRGFEGETEFEGRTGVGAVRASANVALEPLAAGRIRVSDIGLRPAAGAGLWSFIADIAAPGRIPPPRVPLGRLAIDAAVRPPPTPAPAPGAGPSR